MTKLNSLGYGLMVLAFVLGLYFLFHFAVILSGEAEEALPLRPGLYGVSEVYSPIVILALVGYLLHKHESERQ
jgi:hypothetical protein